MFSLRTVFNFNAIRQTGKTQSDSALVLTVPSQTYITAILCKMTFRIPAHNQAKVKGLTGIRRLVRSCRRWQLSLCSWIYEGICSSTCTRGFATRVETGRPQKSYYNNLYAVDAQYFK